MAKKKTPPHFHIYKDDAGEFRIRMVGANGEIVPDGYKGRKGVLRALELMQNAKNYAVVDTTWVKKPPAPSAKAPVHPKPAQGE